MTANLKLKPSPTHELVITRIFDAPRELVWEVWTDPDHARHWMGPEGFAASDFMTEPGVGGRWRLKLHDDSFGDLWQGGVNREVVPPERLVFTFAWEEDGVTQEETLVTVIFEDLGGKTRMTFRHAGFRNVADRDGHLGGWNSTFDRLAAYVLGAKGQAAGQSDAGDDVVVTRVIDAPVELVWKAFTDAERVRKWWGPGNFSSPSARIDLRVGGTYLLAMRTPDGRVFWDTGVYREIVSGKRLVYTDSRADAEGNVLDVAETVITVLFEEADGKTRVTLRHAGLPAGMGKEMAGAGWNGAFDKLAASLRTG